MRSFRLLLLASLALDPCTARAADVPVTYTVDTTALKLDISGTNLSEACDGRDPGPGRALRLSAQWPMIG